MKKILIWLLMELLRSDKIVTKRRQENFIVRDLAFYIDGEVVVLGNPNESIHVSICGTQIEKIKE